MNSASGPPLHKELPRDPHKEVYDRLVSFERDHDVHALAIRDVHFWSALRQEIFEQMYVATGAVKHPITPPAAAQTAKFRLRHIVPNLLLRNPFLIGGHYENLIVKWVRMQPTVDGPDDLIVRALRSLIPRSRRIEMDLFGNYSRQGEPCFSMEMISLLGSLTCKFAPLRLTPVEDALLRDLDQAMTARFGAHLNLRARMPGYLREFLVKQALFRRLLRRWQVRRVFAVVAYGHPALIGAARKDGIPVIEMQHGLIHCLNYAYDVAEGLEPAYQADTLLLYGDYWRGTVRHYGRTLLQVFGAPYIRAHLDRFRPAADAPRRNAVLFLSQSGICQDVLDFALRFARLPDAPDVVFRLHPQDNLEQVKALVADAGVDTAHFEVSAGGGGVQTLTLQAQLRFQVGVYSTAVVEGLVLGCRSFLIPMPGWSGLACLLAEGHANIAATPRDLLSAVLSDTASEMPIMTNAIIDRIFAPEQPEIIARLIK